MQENLSRRRFLGWSLGAATAVVVAACGGDDEAPSSGASDGGDTGGSGSAGSGVGEGVTVAMFASPSCGCCGSHAAYLEEHGFTVDLERTDGLDAIRADLGVPDEVVGCHLAQVEGYVVEGHVPVAAFEKLLAERPEIDGISLPGMPQGSPGMGDDPDASFEILAFTGATVEPFMTT
ncbi:MAG TPA: DUF411 domain-containing protein [Acidimicrobiales bacterium]